MFQKIRNVVGRHTPAAAKPAPPKPKVGHGSQSTFRPATASSPVKLTAPLATPSPLPSQRPALSGADVGRLTADRSSNPNPAALIGGSPDRSTLDGGAASFARALEAGRPSLGATVDMLRVRGDGPDALRSALAGPAALGEKVLADAGRLVAAAAGKLALGTQLGGLVEQAATTLVERAGLDGSAWGALRSDLEQIEATRAALKDDPAGLAAQQELLALGRAATPEEVAAYQQLSDAERAEFRAVAAQVKGNEAAHDALYETLVDGTLTRGFQVGPGTDGPKSALLSELARLGEGSEHLSDEELARLTGEVLVDVANPEAITQGTDYGCAPTNVRAFLAMDNPAEYARLAADMALTGEAELKMVNAQGEPITLHLPKDKEFNPSRSLAEQLVGDTLLDAANGVFNTVGENNESESMLGALAKLPFLPNVVGSSTTNGATAEWTAKMMEMVTGEPHGYLGIGPDSTGLARKLAQSLLFRVVEDLHDRGVEPLVKLVDGDTGHMVRVTDVGEDSVTYYDPALGKETTVSKQEFMSQAELVVTSDASMPDDEKLRMFLDQEESEIPSGQGDDRNRSQDLEPLMRMLRG